MGCKTADMGRTPAADRVDLWHWWSDTWNVVTPSLRPLGRLTVGILSEVWGEMMEEAKAVL
jgi:hypothetical protein